jgi:hypothetical protein
MIIKAGDIITTRTGTYPCIKNDDGLIWYKCPNGQGQTIVEFITAINGVEVPKAKPISYLDIINKIDE